MATKKKDPTDQDYEEFNKMMAEYEANPNSVKVKFFHDDGSLWYQGVRGINLFENSSVRGTKEEKENHRMVLFFFYSVRERRWARNWTASMLRGT